MKILYLTYGLQSGVVRRFTEELVNRGHTVSTHDISGPFKYRYDSIRLPKLTIFNIMNTIHAFKRFGKKWKSLYLRTDLAFRAMSREASRVIKREDSFEVVFQSGVLFNPFMCTSKKPHFLCLLDNTYLIGGLGRRRPPSHFIASKWFIDNERKTYQNADRIFVMSHHVEDSLINDYGIEPTKIIVSGIGPLNAPLDKYSPPKNKYSSGRIVFIGIFFEQKGGYNLISAFSVVHKRIPHSKLILIGGKPLGNIPDGVEVLGLADSNSVKNQLAQASVFVMPSKVEPFGIAFLEAMAFATPCIGTTIEAIPEMITHEETGLLVPPDNIEDLASAILQILERPDLAREMGWRGRRKVLERYSWDSVIEKILEEVDLCLEK